jgi:hypothetical protein
MPVFAASVRALVTPVTIRTSIAGHQAVMVAQRDGFRHLQITTRPVSVLKRPAQTLASRLAATLARARGVRFLRATHPLAESFFATLKNESVHRAVCPTQKKAKDDIVRYIEIFYNRRRLHSALDYRTPHEVRNEYLNRQLVA